jgi:hypothetical protein
METVTKCQAFKNYAKYVTAIVWKHAKKAD